MDFEQNNDNARPPAAYIGGKRRLAAEITKLIASIPHITYAEAFVGMGGVFFRRKLCGKELMHRWQIMSDPTNLSAEAVRRQAGLTQGMRSNVTCLLPKSPPI